MDLIKPNEEVQNQGEEITAVGFSIGLIMRCLHVRKVHGLTFEENEATRTGC
ncbi:hypothetical protein GBA52_003672 [Prunus armeniaca]|nr:hypothetical protein GBA52_003672 [Prunus armeniaca]